MEQRVSMRFCFKLGKTVAETHLMLVQVYGVEAVSKKMYLSGLNALETEKEGVEDEPRSGRPFN